jgi:uncharacterized protein (TIGR00661 family)
MKKALFFVQGDGRGHRTQAISFNEILQKNNYEVIEINVGIHNQPPTTELISQYIKCPIHHFSSPHLVRINDKEISTIKTLTSTITKLPIYSKSISYIHNTIKKNSPDLVIDFYEPLLGLYDLCYNIECPVLHIAHQFMFLHPKYPKSEDFPNARYLANQYTKFIGTRGKRLALSFYKEHDIPTQNLFVVPPLPREQLFSLTTVDEGFILVYLVNNGYRYEILNQAKTIDRVIHCFCSKFWNTSNDVYHEGGVVFHSLNGTKFLDFMTRCHAVVCTAGFETVTEAAYLNKKLLMIPVENHFEQALNAKDAEKCRLGKYSKTFNLSLIDKIPVPNNQTFIKWMNSYQQTFSKFLS